MFDQINEKTAVTDAAGADAVSAEKQDVLIEASSADEHQGVITKDGLDCRY